MKFLIATGIVSGLIMLLYYFKSRKPLRTAAGSMAAGGISLVLVSYFGHFLHITLALSFFNTIIALTLGVPGVVIMAAGKLLLV